MGIGTSGGKRQRHAENNIAASGLIAVPVTLMESPMNGVSFVKSYPHMRANIRVPMNPEPIMP